MSCKDLFQSEACMCGCVRQTERERERERDHILHGLKETEILPPLQGKLHQRNKPHNAINLKVSPSKYHCSTIFILTLFYKSNGDIVNASICPSHRASNRPTMGPSPHLLLNHWGESYLFVRASVVCPFVCHAISS